MVTIIYTSGIELHTHTHTHEHTSNDIVDTRDYCVQNRYHIIKNKPLQNQVRFCDGFLRVK